MYDEYCHHAIPKLNKEVEIKRCEYFVTTLLKIDMESRIHVSAYDSFRIIIVTQGQGQLVDNNGNEYSALVEYMKELNNQKYSVISFFDQRNAK